jgi:HAD superfamily hydrolase (TIGR01549 family)
VLKAIIFDYDGVIADSFPSVFEIYKIMCKEFSVKCPKNIEEFRKAYGHNHFECYKNLGFKPEQYERAEEIFREEIPRANPSLFPEVIEVIETLAQRYKLALVSANYKLGIEKKLLSSGIHKYFSSIFARENNGDRLKKSKALLEVLDKLGVTKNEAIYIGDMALDYKASKEAGLKDVVLVDYGWGYQKEEVPPMLCAINSPLDILNAIALLEEQIST